MKVYGDLQSGNCLKVVWTARYLGRPFEFVPVNVMEGGAKSQAFLAKFPMGQVPAIELDDGRCLAQSNTIIGYLARGSALLPDDPWLLAQVNSWLFWEQYSHEPYVAVCRFHMHYTGLPKETREAKLVQRGEAALDLMEAHLGKGSAYFVGEALTIADIALLAYTRVAHEGGFDLASRRHVTAWIGRCEGVLGL